ncbi:MAG: D-2-hydroxyacid dehydrogenase family protein, partial [Deltaproteobacteria bacterium]|nr:D-2-hydroxyacid dehydrogenase family protein [Deltaproteobacteria bacterium]
MRVAILDDFEGAAARSPAVARLAARVEVSVLQDRLTSDEALAARLGETEVILLIRERTRFGAAQLARLPRLELIAQTGGGVAHIDLNAATARGILITVTGSNSTPAMVELTFGLMVAVLRRIPALDRAMRRGEWPGVAGRQLHGKTLGIVGLGKIGREVARAAHAFGLRVLACGQTLTDERARAVAAVKVSLRELLEQADIVS